MGSAFLRIDIITEAEHIFLEFIHELECHFHFDAILYFLKIDHIMDDLFSLVHVLDIGTDALFLMVFDFLFL